MKKFKILFLLIVFLLPLCLSGCRNNDNNGGNNTEDEWKNKRVVAIKAIPEEQEKSFEYDEFSMDMVKFSVVYEDDTSRTISLDETMLDDTDINKLKKVGNPRIYIMYVDEKTGEQFAMNYIVHLIDSALLDKDLNRGNVHGAVVKAIRDKTQDRIDFIVEKSSGVKALQFKYTCDSNIMKMLKAFENANLNGVFEIDIKDNEVTASIILDTVITEETTLFSVSFEGNFRTSKLKVDTSFANSVYGIDENKIPVELLNVLYHASIK